VSGCDLQARCRRSSLTLLFQRCQFRSSVVAPRYPSFTHRATMAGTDNSDQAGRRDAPRGPKPPEDDERSTPPQGGEPERRRDERRTRRQAGLSKYQPRNRHRL
jgi:hypothetical protein